MRCGKQSRRRYPRQRTTSGDVIFAAMANNGPCWPYLQAHAMGLGS